MRKTVRFAIVTSLSLVAVVAEAALYASGDDLPS